MDPLSAPSAIFPSDLLSSTLFKTFLDERRYLKNVTPSTIEWYETAFKAWQRTAGQLAPPITKSSLQHFVVALRQRNVKPVSVNTYIKALNAFCRWLHEEGHHPDRIELSILKLEKRMVPTLTDAHMTALLSRKPKGFEACRLHAVICFALDTGVRIDEALTLRASGIDYDNLLATVFGKGRKERRVPLSFELRKVLFRWDRLRSARCPRSELMFGTGGRLLAGFPHFAGRPAHACFRPSMDRRNKSRNAFSALSQKA